MKRIIATTGVAVALLLSASAPAFALGDLREALQERKEERTQVSAPEIDVTAGSKAIALLVLALLLAAEGFRRRR